MVNYGDGPMETTATFDAVSGTAEVCQPGRPDRISELPAAIELPPESCAVVVARSS
jgi:hypothetical protein